LNLRQEKKDTLQKNTQAVIPCDGRKKFFRAASIALKKSFAPDV